MKKLIKKNWFFIAAVLIFFGMLLFEPQTGISAFIFAEKNFINSLFMLAPIFTCIGLMDIWIDRDTVIRIMGSKSGIKGAFVALALGVVTAVPIYALLPIAGVLLKKGSKLSNVLIFLCASEDIRIPLLLFEISSFGWRFTFLRFGLNIVAVFTFAFVIEKFLPQVDKKAIYDQADKL